jgi:hypothetical protein
MLIASINKDAPRSIAFFISRFEGANIKKTCSFEIVGVKNMTLG